MGAGDGGGWEGGREAYLRRDGQIQLAYVFDEDFGFKGKNLLRKRGERGVLLAAQDLGEREGGR